MFWKCVERIKAKRSGRTAATTNLSHVLRLLLKRLAEPAGGSDPYPEPVAGTPAPARPMDHGTRSRPDGAAEKAGTTRRGSLASTSTAIGVTRVTPPRVTVARAAARPAAKAAYKRGRGRQQGESIRGVVVGATVEAA